MCVCARLLPGPVCFANWTGIVVEVKRGQLKDGEGSAEKECCWGVGGVGVVLGGAGGLERAAVPYFKRRLREWTNTKSAHRPLQNHTLHIHIQWLFSLS